MNHQAIITKDIADSPTEADKRIKEIFLNLFSLYDKTNPNNS